MTRVGGRKGGLGGIKEEEGVAAREREEEEEERDWDETKCRRAHKCFRAVVKRGLQSAYILTDFCHRATTRSQAAGRERA